MAAIAYSGDFQPAVLARAGKPGSPPRANTGGGGIAR